jgi:hypothetical protein
LSIILDAGAPRARKLSRLPAAINGLRGGMHDESIKRRDLPDIRARLTALVRLYPPGPAS